MTTKTIQKELLEDSDIKDVNLRDGVSITHPYAVAAIRVFSLRSLGITGWEPEITENDALVLDADACYSNATYALALCAATLTWHLLKLCSGDGPLTWFESPDGRKHTMDNYHEWLPVSHIERDMRREEEG